MKMVQAPDWKPLVLDRLLVYDLKKQMQCDCFGIRTAPCEREESSVSLELIELLLASV